jgi:hypothetical protein
MKHRSSLSTLTRTGAVAALAAFLLAAAPSEPDPTLDRDTATVPNKAMATGTVEIDGQAHEFEVVHCAFGPEETGNPQVEFSLHGEDREADLTVDVSRVDMSEAGLGYHDSVIFLIGDPLDPDEVIEATWQGDTAGAQGASEFLSLDGDAVTADDLTFVGVAGTEAGNEMQGSIEATCP